MGMLDFLIPGSSSSISGNLLGVPQREAAERAGELQYQATQEGLAYQKEKDALARQDLMPYSQIGMNTMPLYASMLNPQNQMNYLENNPMFGAAINEAGRGIKNRFGFSGLRGDMQKSLFNNYLAQGDQFINSALNRFQPLMQLGQASAAGQAASGLSSARDANDLRTSGAAAQGAGLVGAANAQSQGAQNVAGLGLAALSMFCDARMKEDVTHVGFTNDGLPLHLFRYKGDPEWRFGPMAQDVEQMQPEAMGPTIGGMKTIIPARIH